VFGIAKTENQAINIANQLQSAGFSPNDISVLFPDKTERAILRTSSIRRPPKAQPPGLAPARCLAERWAGWLESGH
jgi:hypothetical protein